MYDGCQYTSPLGNIMPGASTDKSRVIAGTKKASTALQLHSTGTAMGSSAKRKKEKQKDFQVRPAGHLFQGLANLRRNPNSRSARPKPSPKTTQTQVSDQSVCGTTFDWRSLY
jgi:hypothetical protein